MFRMLAWKIGFEIQNLRKLLGWGQSSRVLYFAYGANLDYRILRRRKIHPFSIRPYVLKGFEMSFSQPGPFKGSGFATVKENRESKVYGFVLELSRVDARRMDYFELVPFMKRHRRVFHFQSEDKFFFYQALQSRGGLKPSKRYLNLILTGLKLHPFVSKEYLASVQASGVGDEKEFNDELDLFFPNKQSWPKGLRQMGTKLEALSVRIFSKFVMNFSPISVLLPAPSKIKLASVHSN